VLLVFQLLMGIPVNSTHASLASSSQGFHSSLMLAVPCQQFVDSYVSGPLSAVTRDLPWALLVYSYASVTQVSRGISVSNYLGVSLHHSKRLIPSVGTKPLQLFLGNPRPYALYCGEPPRPWPCTLVQAARPSRTLGHPNHKLALKIPSNRQKSNTSVPPPQYPYVEPRTKPQKSPTSNSPIKFLFVNQREPFKFPHYKVFHLVTLFSVCLRLLPFFELSPKKTNPS
jgi:hypothetical protein